MQTGTYFIGDPSIFQKICKNLFTTLEFHHLPENLNKEVFFEGYDFAIYKTHLGPGYFHSCDAKSIVCNSGLIGCIPLTPLDMDKIEELKEVGIIKDFHKEFHTKNAAGYIYFGDYSVDTIQHNEDINEDSYAD